MEWINSLSVSKLIETKQDFILSKALPMPFSSVCLVSAKGGTGKTNLSLYLASEYVNDHFGNVALWLTEDDEGNVKHRFNTMIECGIVRDFDEDRVHIITSEPIHFIKNKAGDAIFNDEKFRDLKAYCALNDIRFLVIDPLLAFYGANENDNSQARTFMQPFINWCKEIDINILFIHHSSKGEVTNTRGAGAFIDACRCAYTVSMPLMEVDKKIVEDKYLSAKGHRIIECVKDNRGAIRIIFKTYGDNPFTIKLIPPLSNDNLEIIKSHQGMDFKSFVKNEKQHKCEKIKVEVTEYESDTIDFPDNF